MYTIEDLIELALQTAAKKNDNGLLFNGDVDLSKQDWSVGDPETVYSIASMYAQFSHNIPVEDAEGKILNALTDKYPSKI